MSGTNHHHQQSIVRRPATLPPNFYDQTYVMTTASDRTYAECGSYHPPQSLHVNVSNGGGGGGSMYGSPPLLPPHHPTSHNHPTHHPQDSGVDARKEFDVHMPVGTGQQQNMQNNAPYSHQAPRTRTTPMRHLVSPFQESLTSR